jgi:hypothetical protein
MILHGRTGVGLFSLTVELQGPAITLLSQWMIARVRRSSTEVVNERDDG